MRHRPRLKNPNRLKKFWNRKPLKRRNKKNVAPVEKKPATEQPIAVEEKPKAKVVTTIENGREIKTITDEKGNVKVRKFLDLSAAAKSLRLRLIGALNAAVSFRADKIPRTEQT